ncbi:MAG: hypothetical protein JXA42_03280, partial [Anaerolineales bacterium]|nr:hypothetical protein [Anaerolineales bacterium]
MNTRQEMLAEELDIYLTALQAGRKVEPPASLPAAETDLLADLLALSAAQEPDPAGMATLETRLRITARRRVAAPSHVSTRQPDKQPRSRERGFQMKTFAFLA